MVEAAATLPQSTERQHAARPLHATLSRVSVTDSIRRCGVSQRLLDPADVLDRTAQSSRARPLSFR